MANPKNGLNLIPNPLSARTLDVILANKKTKTEIERKKSKQKNNSTHNCWRLFMFILYKSYQVDNIFAVFFYILLGILDIILVSKVISENLAEFNGKTKSLVPTFIAVFTIFSILGLYIYYENLERSKTFIHAVGNGLIIDLKENGNYIIRSGSWGGRIVIMEIT